MCKSASHSKYPSTVNCKFWPGSIQVTVFKFSATSSFSKSCKLRSLLLKWAKKVNHYIVFMLFSYLCYRCFNHPANMISLDDIARDVHVTISTVKKYSSALVNTGHVSADLSLISNLQCGKTKIFSHYPTESFCWNSHLLYLWSMLICCWLKIAKHTPAIPATTLSPPQQACPRILYWKNPCPFGNEAHCCGAKQLFW